jgi:hypothetical protein
MTIKTFINGNSTLTVSDDDTKVTGASDFFQTVIIARNAKNVETDANIERINLFDKLADYKFVSVPGVGIQIQNADNVVIATIPSMNQSMTIAFADGSASLVQTGASTFTLGGQNVLTVAELINITPNKPTFTVTSDTPGVKEGADAVFTVTLNEPQSFATTVDYSLTSEGGAALGSDVNAVLKSDVHTDGKMTITGATYYTERPTTLLFNPGQTTATIKIPVILDGALEEPGEGMTLTLKSPSNNILGNDSSKTINFIDVTPIVTLKTDSTSFVNEGEIIVLKAAYDLAGFVAPTDLSIPYALTGSAVNNDDYTGSVGTIKINKGESEGTLTLNTFKDNLIEGSETITATLGKTQGVEVNENSVTVTIQDTKATASLSGLINPVNEGGAAVYTVNLSGIAGKNLDIPYSLSGTATNGDDYTGGKLSILEGSSSATLILPITADSKTEGNETIIVTLGISADYNISGSSAITTTINDTSKSNSVVPVVPGVTDSTQKVTLSAVSTSPVNEGGIIVLKAAYDVAGSVAPTDLSIPYELTGSAVNNADYTRSVGAIKINKGESGGTLTLNTLNDYLIEGQETITATLLKTQGVEVNENSVTITINDTNATASLSELINPVNEGGTAVYTVNLSGIAGKNLDIPYSLSGTAINSVDYTGNTATGRLSVSTGSSSATLTLHVVSDLTTEGNETIIVTLGNSADYSISGSSTVTTNVNDTSVPATPTTPATPATPATISLAKGDSGTYNSNNFGSGAISTSRFKVIQGLTHDDTIIISSYIGANNQLSFKSSVNYVPVVFDNTVVIGEGWYNPNLNSFTVLGYGKGIDTLLAYDSNPELGSTEARSYEAVVLVGIVFPTDPTITSAGTITL